MEFLILKVRYPIIPIITHWLHGMLKNSGIMQAVMGIL